MGQYRLQNSSWHKKYPFLSYLTVFLIGILSHKSFFISMKETALWSYFLLFLVLALIFHILKTTKQHLNFSRSIFLYLSFFMLGSICDFHNDIRNQEQWYGHHLQRAEVLKIRTSDSPERKEKTILIPAQVEGVYINDSFQPTGGSIKVYLYLSDSLKEIQSGTTLIIPNHLIEIKGNGNPHSFDYAEYLKNNNLFHQVFLSQDAILAFPKKNDNRNSFAAKLRTKLQESIRNNIADSITSSMVAATLLNDRSMLDDELWQAYSVTGIAHIIAISGMHVSILFGVLLFLLRWIKSKKLEWIKYFIAIPLVWLYIIITNYPPSAVRAAVMFTLLACSIKLNRRSGSINILIVAGFILLFYNTNWIYDTGVQLSFSAVLSIYIFYQPIKMLWRPTSKIIEYLWNVVSVSLAAQVLVFPLVIYYFHQFPVWVLLANIPATFYSLLLMIGALGIFVLDAVSIPCQWLGELLTYMTDLFHLVIYFFSENTPKIMQHFYLSELDFWILMIAVLFLSAFFLKKKTLFLFSGLGTIILMVINLTIQDLYAAKQRKIIVYNISGNSVIDYIEGKKHRSIQQPDQVMSSKDYQFNLFPAHLGFRMMDTLKKEISSDFWEINNKKILYLSANSRQTTNDTFPIDYLILNKECVFNPEFWYEAFRPQKIILDGSFPRWKAMKWKNDLTEMDVPVHWVQEDGAWVFE